MTGRAGHVSPEPGLLRNAPLECTLAASISEIGEANWQSLLSCSEPLMSYGFFTAMERGGIGPSNWMYLVLHRDGTVVGALPLQHFASLDLLDLLGHEARRRLRGVRRLLPSLFRINAIFAGNPLGEGRLLLRPDESIEEACLAVVAKLRDVAGAVRANWVIWKDMPGEQAPAARPALNQAGFFLAPALPDAVLCLEQDCFEDYIAALPAKPRRNLRAKQRRLQKSTDIELTVTSTTGERTHELMALYGQVLARAESRLDLLTPEFLDALLEAQDVETELIVATNKDSRALAFLLTVARGDTVVALRVGLDYENSKQAALYHNVHYKAIELAFSRGRSRVELLQTAYEAKLEMGCHLVELEHAVWHSNRLLRGLLARILPAALASADSPKPGRAAGVAGVPQLVRSRSRSQAISSNPS